MDLINNFWINQTKPVKSFFLGFVWVKIVLKLSAWKTHPVQPNQQMEVGQPGPHGQHVQQIVEEVTEVGTETATTLRLKTEDSTVKATILNMKPAMNNPVSKSTDKCISLNGSLTITFPYVIFIKRGFESLARPQ